MSINLVTLVRDDHEALARLLTSTRGLIDTWTVVDTGSDDQGSLEHTLLQATDDGGLHHAPWRSFGENRTEAMRLAAGRADWHLFLDADMTVEAHEDLLAWLDTDPDPDVTAWLVDVREADILYGLPLLLRDGIPWQWEGVTHEYLVPHGKQRPLLGLTVTHHTDGANRATKHERDLELLAERVVSEDPRSIYYTAQALRCLGRTEDAAVMYALRATLGGFEEERWHALYMAARLREDPEALVAAWKERPHRPEPLRHAARLVGERPSNDVLFLER